MNAVMTRLQEKVDALEKERDGWKMLAGEKEKIALELHNHKERLEKERDDLKTALQNLRQESLTDIRKYQDEREELRARVLDLSSRLGFVMGSLQGLRCHNLSELTRTRLEEAIKAAEDQGK